MKQVFRKIPSLDFRYEITRDGVVRNIKSKKIKKQKITKFGYYRTSYRVNKSNPHYNSKQGWDRLLHELVMECWGQPKPNWAECIDHIDRNKLNNDISNLRWATYSQNTLNTDLITRGKKHSQRLSESDKIKRCPIKLVDKNGNEHIFRSRFDASKWLIDNHYLTTKNARALSSRIAKQKYVAGFDIINI